MKKITKIWFFRLILRIKKWFLILWWCKILKWHKWTCANQKGFLPTEEQKGSIQGFYEYAKMYCDRCGYVYPKSEQLICKYKNLESKLEA